MFDMNELSQFSAQYKNMASDDVLDLKVSNVAI